MSASAPSLRSKASKPMSGQQCLTPFAVKADGLPQLNTDGIITGKNLFNGNINSILVNVPKIGDARLYGYRYDQLNRIKAMNAYSGLNTSTNAITPAVMPDYKERVTYDANGNIESYLRNGTTANSNQLAMDDLTYHYTSGTNKLNRVADAVGDGNYSIDIDNQSSVNYEYDAIGNMVRDKAEGLYDASDPTKDMIEWNVYGKISKITKIKNSVTTVIEYRYDAAGNRIEKKVGSKITAYVRDATGNVMAVYEKGGEVNSGHLTQVEVHLYGSSRLGLWRGDRDVEVTNWQLFDTDPMQGTTNGILPEKWVRGKTVYELSNHLGNVLVTISDKKLGIDETADQEIDHYEAEIVSANDYYPFGMGMPERKFSSDSYRYGFNGKENSPEINSGAISFEARIYDSRLGRYFSVDPLASDYSWQSPYAYHRNCPTSLADFLGMGDPPTSTKNDALNRITELSKNLKQSSHFKNVKPEEFIKSLTERVNTPDGLNQGEETNFCWAAACMSYTYNSDPKGLVDAMFSLYNTGTFTYQNGTDKSVSITPLNYINDAVGGAAFNNEGALANNKADQMLFMTLSAGFKGYMNTDRKYDTGDEENPSWSGGNFTKAVNLWQSFGHNITYSGADLSNIATRGYGANQMANSLSSLMSAGFDVTLFVNSPKFKDKPWGELKNISGTHYIRVTGISVLSNSINLNYWDYGKWTTNHSLTPRQFRTSMYGYIAVKSVIK